MQAPEQQTILITGATDGLGRGLAAELAATGATVLIHGRDEERGRQTPAEIESASGNEQLRWLRADLSSLEEVRRLSGRVVAECDRLDVLVNNAGIGTTLPGEGRRLESRDGYELRFAVNRGDARRPEDRRLPTGPRTRWPHWTRCCDAASDSVARTLWQRNSDRARTPARAYGWTWNL